MFILEKCIWINAAIIIYSSPFTVLRSTQYSCWTVLCMFCSSLLYFADMILCLCWFNNEQCHADTCINFNMCIRASSWLLVTNVMILQNAKWLSVRFKKSFNSLQMKISLFLCFLINMKNFASFCWTNKTYFYSTRSENNTPRY